MPLTKNATNMAIVAPCRANGLKQKDRNSSSETAGFQRLVQNSLTEVERYGDRIGAGAVSPINAVSKLWHAVAISAIARMAIPNASHRTSSQTPIPEIVSAAAKKAAKIAVAAMS